MRRKKFLLALVVFMGIILMPIISTASNESVQLVRESDTNYIIYIEGYSNEELEFAFSNNKNSDKYSLTYKTSAVDSFTAGNSILYIDTYTSENKYLWVRDLSGNYILECVEINLSDALTEAELESIQEVTRRIPIDTTETSETEKTYDNTKIITKTSKVIIKDVGEYKYQIIKASNSKDYENFMRLSEKIFKINEETDIYTKLEAYEEFNKLYKKLSADLDEASWDVATNNEILQPSNATDGEKYILWLKGNNSLEKIGVLDVQFMTSTRVETEQELREEVRTKLPVTYDNNLLLYILFGIIVAIIVTIIRIRTLNKKVT